MGLWARLFRSDRAKITAIKLEDVSAAPLPSPEMEQEQDLLILKLLRGATEAAYLSGKIRKQVTAQVALGLNGR